MSIEQSKVWQVIRYIDNINSSGESATQHVKTIAPHHEHHEDGDFDEEEEDSYNHLIEEDDEEEEEEDEDFISYDSESSTSAPAPLMDSSTAIIQRPPMMLDLAMAGSNGPSSHDVRPEHNHLNHSQQHLQGSPRLVYVKLGDSTDHVITVNRPMGEELGRMLTSNGTVVNLTSTATVPEHLNITSTTANDEELTSLTWLQDKNLIQGINLTTSKSHQANTAPPTENAVTISPNCDKQKQIVTLNGRGETVVVSSVVNSSSSSNSNGTATENGGLVSSSYVDGGGIKTMAISELASKILGSASLPPSISHLLPARGQSSPPATVRTTEVPVAGQGTPQPHVHKKYRREEHVKISKQQQQQQQPAHHSQQQLQLTPNHSSSASHSPYSERSMSSRKYSEESLSYHHQSPGNRSGSKQGGAGNKQKHPINVPYNPYVHTNNKPPLSFSSLIFMAIENATEKALPVKEIYAWIVKHFPYFKTAPTGWKNSVRHNLSLNKCFQKVEKAPHMGKGSLWKVEQQYRQVLMQALTRSPYHQFAGALDKSDEGFTADTNNNNMLMCNSSPSSSTISSTSSSLSTSPTGMDPHNHHHNHHQSGMKMANGRPFDPVLYPYLSKEISKLDSNNNAYFANSHYNLSCVDSESESTGYYENSVDGDSVHGYQHRFNGYTNYSQYPYDGHVDNSTDNMDDVNAATAMLALKHGSKIFDGGIRNGQPVITTSPSEDHTYSAGNENSEESAADKANGSVGSINGVQGQERAPLDQSDHEIEEQRKKAEGVDALLNLAGFASHTTSQILMKRRASSDMMSNSNSMDSSNGAIIFSSPSPTKRSKTRYLQSAV